MDEYNSALFKIVSKLKLCGEEITDKDMLEKTFSTFHTSNVLLQQQYREKGFTTYANLISCLLLAEKNNELLMRNSELRPHGSTRWSHVYLLSTRNLAFARVLAQIILLRAHFPDFSLKTIRLDNAGEFTSQAFNDYCMSMGVSVEHFVAHVQTQNGLAESFIKRI